MMQTWGWGKEGKHCNGSQSGVYSNFTFLVDGNQSSSTEINGNRLGALVYSKSHMHIPQLGRRAWCYADIPGGSGPEILMTFHRQCTVLMGPVSKAAIPRKRRKLLSV